MKKILITKVKDKYGWLSLMSPHPVAYKGAEYRTCEALFQCLRFQKYPEVQKEIIEAKSPMAAKMIARKNREKLDRGKLWDEASEDLGWMKLCMYLKIKQHPELKEKLIKTGKAMIIEDCTTHPRESARFWGAVKIKEGQWEGENNLGRLWMQIRKTLISEKPKLKTYSS